MRSDLVTRAQAGDEDAFTELAASMADQGYAVAYRILRDTARAEDATQAALMTAWQRLRTLREPDRFEAWFHRILVNGCRDELRRRASWDAKVSMAEASAEGWEADTSVSVGERDELERAFARLSPDHRAAVVLRHYLGWTTEEIADALAIPAGTVSSRIHYALAALRTALEADATATNRPREAGA